MNLYEYLKSRPCNVAREAGEAYKRFQEYRRQPLPRPEDVDPFVFAFVDDGYQAFTFKPDQVVDMGGRLAIVTGWSKAVTGWRVCVKTAEGELRRQAEDFKPAAFPEGLVEILRGKVHAKVDEAFV